jgi:hypothetical protein
MSLNTEKKYHIIWALLLIVLTLLFKWQTGSFLTISDKSHKQVVAYEMKKRQEDITLASLSESCINIQALGAPLKTTVLNEPELADKMHISANTPEDSTVYKLIHQALNCSQYNKTIYISEFEQVTWIYQMKNNIPVDSFGVLFREEDDNFLIADILGINAFLLNSCL